MRLDTALMNESLTLAGRTVDTLTGQPLPGNVLLFVFAELFRCNGDDCFEVVNSQSVDGEGRFQFDVPAFVLGATFCARVFLGLDPSPLVITVREAFLFCITGGDTEFQVMSEGESQKIFKVLSGKSETLRKLPTR